MHSSTRDYLVLSRIEQGKELRRKTSSVSILNYGPFYVVCLYETQVAIGLKGAMPFAVCLNGWTTRTTLDFVRSLGFYIHSQKVCTGSVRNEKTKRMNKVYEKKYFLNGTMMEDVYSWYHVSGKRLPGMNFNLPRTRDSHGRMSVASYDLYPGTIGSLIPPNITMLTNIPH